MPQIEQYLPRLVREWDELAPGELHRSIDGSMVFVDVSGFTKLFERLARHGKVGTEEVTEVIARTFDRLLGEAYAYGASLLKFGGDALLLFFQGSLILTMPAIAKGGLVLFHPVLWGSALPFRSAVTSAWLTDRSGGLPPARVITGGKVGKRSTTTLRRWRFRHP